MKTGPRGCEFACLNPVRGWLWNALEQQHKEEGRNRIDALSGGPQRCPGVILGEGG
jgi:hypothetical protein